MRIITLNTNGIRAAERKGLFSWLAEQNADIICLQEIKAHPDQLSNPAFWPSNYQCFYHPAQKKGYSGVALLTRKTPRKVSYGIGWEDFDQEGRFIETKFDNLSVISIYLPSGASGEARQTIKFNFLERFEAYLEHRAQQKRDIIICGDWNIAHREIDLKNWRGNLQNPGFLPEERAWLDRLFTTGQWFDAFRIVNPSAEQYTWWSSRGQAWANNAGWRIDYQIISAALSRTVKSASIFKTMRFSDHAPLIIDYDYSF